MSFQFVLLEWRTKLFRHPSQVKQRARKHGRQGTHYMRRSRNYILLQAHRQLPRFNKMQKKKPKCDSENMRNVLKLTEKQLLSAGKDYYDDWLTQQLVFNSCATLRLFPDAVQYTEWHWARRAYKRRLLVTGRLRRVAREGLPGARIIPQLHWEKSEQKLILLSG